MTVPTTPATAMTAPMAAVFDVPSAPWDPASEPRTADPDRWLRRECALLRMLLIRRQEQLDLAHEQIGLRDREIARLDWRRG